MKYFISLQFLETIIAVICAVVIVMCSRALDKKIVQARNANQKLLKIIKIFTEVFNIVLIIMLFVVALTINGVNVKSAIRSLGIIGIIVGFALNDLLKDFVMGISIMFEGYFKVGDNVIYNGNLGKVVSFNIKTTKIFMYATEETLSVSNRNITEISKASDWIDIDIPIGYDISPKYARVLCKKCASRIERLRYVYSCDFLNTQNLEESWVTYKIRIHHLVDKQPSVRRNALAVIQDVFAENKVPFPLSIKVLFGEDNYKAAAAARYSIEEVKNNSTSSIKEYELGRGAAKSKDISFDGSNESIQKVMKEVERYTRAENLDKKMSLRIRLLSEELVSLTRSLDNMKDGSYHIERCDTDYELVFEAFAIISKEKKKAIKKTASEVGSSGFTDIIKDAVNTMLKKSFSSDEDDLSDSVVEETRWSYNVYKEENTNYENLFEENVLEKSVITSMADDLKISVMKNRVKIRVLVKNIEEE